MKPILLLAPLVLRDAAAFVCPPLAAASVASCARASSLQPQADDARTHSPAATTELRASPEAVDGPPAAAEISRAPTLNGKVVLPVKALTAGLKGHKVAAVYAILNAGYKRGAGEGWEHVQHVGVTRDLASDISHFLGDKGAAEVAHVRALSFAYPQKATMVDFAAGWKEKVAAAGGAGAGEGWGMAGAATGGESANEATTTDATAEGVANVVTVGDEYEFDDDEDMDEDDLDDYLQMMAEARGATSPPPPAPLFVDNTGLSGIESLNPTKDADEKEKEVISPFESAVDKATVAAESVGAGTELELTTENVDKVLDEVRPYLISDGGNVSVQSVDPENGNVYLLLEGACGSCASSTVTMQMGIERVLREKFGDRLGEVAQVDPDEGEGGGKPTELTVEAVQAEVNRMSQAIVAMGGVVRVANVDPIGEVEIEFRGPNRVKKGLELALLDVEYVKHVKFVA
ncbi:hypothetical protein ACHAXT_013352 [Thalassiosira profunda]